MNRVAVTFSATTALLEDIHVVAVEGRAPELSPDEMMPLVARLRAYTRDLKRHIVVAATDVNR